MSTFFSDYFAIDPAVIEAHGAFNVSIVNDLPLFIDPFLLFNSKKPEYQDLHDTIIAYLVYLRDKAETGVATDAELKLWYCFPEVKQNWLGFSISGNSGSGLGLDFARALHTNLHRIFHNFGDERITTGSHLEKVCLVAEGVGRDSVSDFTTNLIKDFLCQYTQDFALQYLADDQRREVAINNARFNFTTQSWERGLYQLPWVNGDFVLLTPKDMLTRDENWINRRDLVDRFESIPVAISDGALRAQVENYFRSVLVRPKDREPSKKERGDAAVRTILQFPQLIDYYIRLKEEQGDAAHNISSEKVRLTEQFFIEQLRALQQSLIRETAFYQYLGNTYDETHARLAYLKDVIENKGGHRIFYDRGEPIQRETDLQILFRLVWFGSPSDTSAEVNDGRGPVDFKISRGARDKTLVEMKLAKNTQLKRNLQKQVPIYQRASDASNAIKAILFFTYEQHRRVVGILKELGLEGDPDIILIDARSDNKPSGSKA